MHGRILCSLAGLLFLVGCQRSEPVENEEPTPQAPRAFDPSACGCLEGRVLWRGDFPDVPAVDGRVNLLNQPGHVDRVRVENPLVPRIETATRGVAGAVVYLRGVDPKQSRPWDHPPVRIEQRDWRIAVMQGATDSAIGFVHKGESVEMLSTQPIFHSLRATGAGFFTQQFPDPEQAQQKRFERTGIVELTSGAGYWWMRGFLFVLDHPYITRTDAEGCFTLHQIPPGQYEVVCWLPNWQEERRERDPESSFVTRLRLQPPWERSSTVEIGSGETRQRSVQLP